MIFIQKGYGGCSYWAIKGNFEETKRKKERGREKEGKEGKKKKKERETFLVAQWLRLCAFPAEGMGSIPGQGTKIPCTTHNDQKNGEKKKENKIFREQNWGF